MNREKQLDDLAETLVRIKSKQEMRSFLVGILTPKELLELPMRLVIVKMLKQGVSQHEIASKLGVGIATVTRGSKEIQKGYFTNI